MPRLNIYIPDDLDLAIRSLPGEINISKVCAAALRAHIAGSSEARIAGSMFHNIYDKPGIVEQIVLQHYPGLLWVVAPETGETERETAQDVVAESTSYFLQRTFFEGCVLGVGGGRHMWDVVRRLDRRNLGMKIWALGYAHVDRHAPHLHPNALVTHMSVLYAPRSTAHLVGAERLDRAWHFPTLYPKDMHEVKRYIVGSCGIFDAESKYAQLLGKEMTDFLMEEHVMGEYLGVFITPDGRLVEPYAPNMTVSHVPSTDLQELAKRDDTFVILSAVGLHKVKLIKAVLQAGLCNVLFTDHDTAFSLCGIDKPKFDENGERV